MQGAADNLLLVIFHLPVSGGKFGTDNMLFLLISVTSRRFWHIMLFIVGK